MKKNKKIQKQKVTSKEQLQHAAEKTKALFAAHGVFIMFLLAGTSIGYALYKGKTYLTPIRDENKYQELSAQSYSKIDYALVNKLSEALSDKQVTVTSSNNPTRSNPFSE
jgi:hypothetical protein